MPQEVTQKQFQPNRYFLYIWLNCLNIARYFLTARTLSILIAVTISLPLCANSNDLNIITGYSTVEKNNNTRIILSFSKNPEYKIATLENPDRIVIDLKNTSWPETIDAASTSPLVTGIRHNVRSGSDLRLVLDLRASFKISNYFLLPEKENLHRLLIDVTPQGKFTPPPQPISRAGEDISIPVPKLKEVIKPLIAIDAGHGGHDPGTTGYHGSEEKIITLSFAYTLKKALEETGRYNVILTRKDDTYIELKKRVEIARNAKANMFLSLHADAHNNRTMNGLSVYTISEKASDKEAEALAQKENNAGVLNNMDISGDTQDITELLIDLVQRESKNLSADFAECIISEVRTKTEVLHKNPHRFAGFRVLTAPDIPSVLIELGYLSNRKEERLLLSTNHKKKLAEAIVRSIDKHFSKYPVD